MAVLLIASKAGELGGGEPIEVFGEPVADSGEVIRRGGLGGSEEGDRLGDLGETGSVEDALEAWRARSGEEVGEVEVWGHAGAGRDKPGAKVFDGVRCVMIGGLGLRLSG